MVSLRPSTSLRSAQDYSTIDSLHGIAVRVGVAKKDFERAFIFRHEISRRNGSVKLYDRFDHYRFHNSVMDAILHKENNGKTSAINMGI